MTEFFLLVGGLTCDTVGLKEDGDQDGYAARFLLQAFRPPN
jgi:hypothetical protein